jgi:putative transposase
MSPPEYRWRQLTARQQAELLAWRRERGYPWHSPPHRADTGPLHFHITAACFEHQPYIGHSPARLDAFTRDLLGLFTAHASQVFAWCVLPNHYHALIETLGISGLLYDLGRFHGRTSHAWYGEENARGRQVFFRAIERMMRSDRHLWATLNYVHHNPVHHGYVTRWTDWPWSSATEFLAQTDADEAKRIWREYPLDDYGQGWDDPAL